ncbi:GFA family protein [Pseudocolwellia sp. HL-MZ19]|uniref:GFA family protein n=1 Tax=unclassified Pseudocolwellia TaxID=2848178 RepID=UPI003CED0AA2
MTYPIKGTCQCGNISYTIKAKPTKVMACHCQECRKLSTSAFSITIVVDTNDIEFSGTFNEWVRIADSGNKNHAKFCVGCGNRVYHYNPDDLSSIRLKLQPIDVADDTIFQPSVHVWVSEKLSWFVIPENITAFPKQAS